MTSADLLATLKKHPIGFVCGFMALACGAWTYFRGTDIDTLKATFEQKSGEASKMMTNVRNAEKLAQHVEEMQAISKEVTSRLIRPGQLAVNLQYFYKLEADTGVKLNDVRQAPLAKSAAAKATLFVPVGYNVSLQGSFSQVMQFVQRLETGPHFSRFNNVNVSKVGGQTGEGAVSVAPDAMNVTINLELLGQP